MLWVYTFTDGVTAIPLATDTNGPATRSSRLLGRNRGLPHPAVRAEPAGTPNPSQPHDPKDRRARADQCQTSIPPGRDRNHIAQACRRTR